MHMQFRTHVRSALAGALQLVTQALDRVAVSYSQGKEYTAPSLAEMVEQARREWLGAKAYYEEVTDPDLVDHAAYAIQAAEKKYIFLLKRARAEGIRLPEERVFADRVN